MAIIRTAFIILFSMVRRLAYHFRFPLVWIVGCIGLTIIFISVVSPLFHVDLIPKTSNVYPFYYLDIDEGDSYDEVTGDYVERLLDYRGTYVPRLIYNRVPKCGSETVRFIMLRLAWFNDFNWITSTLYLNYTLSIEDQHEFMKSVINTNTPIMYERHVHFIDFRRFGAEQPLYTNLVRDPVDRLVSWYYFVRFQEGHIREMPEWRRNMTYDECVQQDFHECVSEHNYFRVIPFFCGHSYECRTQSEASLALAKRHLDEDYIAVGVADDIRNYFVVMEYLLPDYFNGAVNMYDVLGNDLKEGTKTKKKRAISQYTRNIMQQKLKHEYEFYYFVKQRFYRLLYLVEHAKSQNNT